MKLHLFSFMISPFSFLRNLCQSCEIVLPVFSFRNFIVVAFKFLSMILLDLLFRTWCEIEVKVHLPPHVYSVVPVLFVKKLFLSPTELLGHLGKEKQQQLTV